ncbi:putative uncharacterized protein DDB_G0271982 [Coccinella septempunctata]|uniref:putative uncharacterized protein DDB_G0271982 n=1 Tax=Coccinella septempunctata TaxID=41139 RepID=UPI001D08809F|nr:putative uncharacterized protein DDB_G0271982 [Coccinella septempunctata]
MLEPKYPCMLSYSTNDVINACDSRDSYVFKKFINAAIYVEKTIQKMAPDLQNYEKHLAETIKIMKTKRCSCNIDADSCPCHPTMASGDGLKGTRSETRINCEDSNFSENLEKLKSINKNINKTIIKRPMQTKISKQIIQPILQKKISKPTFKLQLSELDDGLSPKAVPSETNLGQSRNREPNKVTENPEINKSYLSELDTKNEIVRKSKTDDQESDNESEGSTTSSSTLSTCSQITVRRSDKGFMCDTKVSLSSLTSFTPTDNNSVRQWLSKKMEEQKKRQQAQREEERKKQLEREKILQKERENFKMWLAAKKRDEDKRKAEMERQQQLDQLRELEKQKRHLENQIRYQIWLKRKEEADIEKKNQEQLKILQAKIEKERRTIANQKAFEEWLEFSKNKPRPLPLNQGLDSLRSSLSVTYVNPVPWVPNIDLKPASQ